MEIHVVRCVSPFFLSLPRTVFRAIFAAKKNMEYKVMREKAVKWINSAKRDFNDGIAILEEAKFKPGVIAILKRQGVAGPSASERLIYHMRTFIKVWFDERLAEDTDLELGVVKGIEVKAEKKEAVPMFSEEMTARMASMPDDVAELVRKYRNSYIERDKLFKALQDVPEDNSPENKEIRKKLSDKIEAETELQDKLYIVYDGWFRTGKLVHVETEEKKKRVMLEDGLAEIDSMSKHQLRKLRKSLATKIARAKNMLDFQSETKQPALNPLPAGTARIKFESKIERLTGELKKVEVEIAKRA